LVLQKIELTVLRVFLGLRPPNVNGPWSITYGATSSENIWCNSEHQSRRLNLKFRMLYIGFRKSCNFCFITVNLNPLDYLLTAASSYINYTANVLSILDRFEKLRKPNISCVTSACLHRKNRLTMKKFSENLDKNFSKICLENLRSIKIWQE
jgi:hypothetical protein